MSEQTRRESRERAKRFKKSGQKGTEAAMKFESQDKAEGVVMREKPKEEPKEKAVVRSAETGVTNPAPTEDMLGKPSKEKVARLQQATIGGLAVGSVFASIAKVGATLLTSEGLSAPAVASAATGTIARLGLYATKGVTKSAARLGTAAAYISQVYPKVPLTTVIARKSISYIGKLVTGFKNPAIALSIFGSYFGTRAWASWSKTEGLEGLAFAERQAVYDENLELADEIHETYMEIAEGSTWETVISHIPAINVLRATKAKDLASEYMDKTLQLKSQMLRGEYKVPISEQQKRKEEEEYWEKIRASWK